MSVTIGDFARLGGVSARMLRHYDRIGLLRPERVDDDSGYRYYGAWQLTRLNRLVVLKDLGFTLDEVADLLDTDDSATHDQLARRRAELQASIEADRRRLTAIDARLSLIDDEPDGTRLAIIDKELPRLQLTQFRGQVDDAGELGDVVGPLFARLIRTLTERGAAPQLPSYAWYETTGDTMHFGVGYPMALPTGPTAGTPGGQPDSGVEIHELTGQPRALAVVHHGHIERIAGTWQGLAREAEARGLIAAGPGREVYLELPADEPENWVTEVQLPVRPDPFAAAGRSDRPTA